MRHRRSCDRSRSCWISVPGTDLFASLGGLVRFDPPRVYRLAAASRCIRLDIRKANRGRRCRTVCKCYLQTRLASCTPGHVCYDENVGSCRLVLARPAALSPILVPGFRRLDRLLPMWPGRMHMNRHPGQSDGHCERIDKTLCLPISIRIRISSCCSSQVCLLFHSTPFRSHPHNKASSFLVLALECIIQHLCNQPSVFHVIVSSDKQSSLNPSSRCTARVAPKSFAV